MLLRNLDLDILRTLITAHDLGGFAQAADRLGRTPAAISLQMKRLQEELGTPLFRKHGRVLKLTEAGQTALGYARRMLALNDDLLQTMQGATLAGTVRIGAPQDFAALLPDALRQFAALYPRTQIELRIEGNGALIEALDKSQLDNWIRGSEGRSAAGRTACALDREPSFPHTRWFSPTCCTWPSMRLPQGRGTAARNRRHPASYRGHQPKPGRPMGRASRRAWHYRTHRYATASSSSGE